MLIQTAGAFILIGCFFFVEAIFRTKGTAKSMKRGRSDRGSTVALGASYAVAVVLLVILAVMRVGNLSSPFAGWAGLLVMLLGLGVRAWSMRVLGASYSRTLKVSGAQDIVDGGPYRFIRHPGYLGSILVWVGSGLALSNWIALCVVGGMMICVYAYRIHAEEAMLVAAFGEKYREYAKRSWRLVPFLY